MVGAHPHNFFIILQNSSSRQLYVVVNVTARHQVVYPLSNEILTNNCFSVRWIIPKSLWRQAALFHTSLWSLSYQNMDTCNPQSTYQWVRKLEMRQKYLMSIAEKEIERDSEVKRERESEKARERAIKRAIETERAINRTRERSRDCWQKRLFSVKRVCRFNKFYPLLYQ